MKASTKKVGAAKADATPPTSGATPPASEEARRLDAALARVGRAPRDVEALIAAAEASSLNGDDDAAIGFYRRAALVAPDDARVLTGLARSLYRTNDPVGALLVYDRAERLAPLMSGAAGDRGLAYDLVGDNARAQRSYRLSLTLSESAEITRRLALSQTIAGDSRSAEATLRPLLQQQDKAAWRIRAFIFAITGQIDEAVTVAKTLLPGDLAAAMTPYLRYMPRLTRAQQAAAANLGVFPAAAAIGRDDPRIVRYGMSGPAALARADLTLTPAGAPLGPSDKPGRGNPGGPYGGSAAPKRSGHSAQATPRTAPPEPPPALRITSADGLTGADPTAPPAPLAGLHVAPPAAAGGMAPAPRSPRPVPSRTSLAEAFRDIGAPDLPVTRRADAVDITRLDTSPAAMAAKPAPKPPKVVRVPPSQPSRIWVQVGVGRDHAAMMADWRRMARQGGKALADRQPFVSDAGGRDRMLTGPFETQAAARAFISQLDAAGISGPYTWISPAGQVVDTLAPR